MNRLISILITLVVLFLVYIWINSVMSKKKDAAAFSAQTESSVDKNDEPSLKLSNYDASRQDPHKNPSSNKSTSAEDVAKKQTSKIGDQNNAGSAESTDDKDDLKNKPSINNAPQKKATHPGFSKANDPAKQHMVIAGSFSHRENAVSRKKDLQREGYEQVEIVNFDLTELHTVCAGRFDDLREARRISKKIRDYLKIPAYVRVGKS